MVGGLTIYYGSLDPLDRRGMRTIGSSWQRPAAMLNLNKTTSQIDAGQRKWFIQKGKKRISGGKPKVKEFIPGMGKCQHRHLQKGWGGERYQTGIKKNPNLPPLSEGGPRANSGAQVKREKVQDGKGRRKERVPPVGGSSTESQTNRRLEYPWLGHKKKIKVKGGWKRREKGGGFLELSWEREGD